jgi:MFS family permease
VQGVFAAVFSMSSIIGPLIGGWFVEVLSWHWIFFINIPLGAAAVFGFAIAFRPQGNRKQHKIDYAGAVLLSLALGSLVLITSLGGRTFDWSSIEIIGLALVGLSSAFGFIYVEAKASEPVLPLKLFSQNVFVVTSIIGFISGAAMFGAITFLPLYLQIAQGSSPTLSGLQLIPMTAGILVSSTIAGRGMSKGSKYRWMPLAGTATLFVGMLLLSSLSPETPYVQVGIFIAVVGFGMGFIFPVVTTAVQNSVSPELVGTATAAGLMFRQIGGSLGVALFGAIFANRMADQLSGLGGGSGIAMGAEFNIGPQTMAGLPAPIRETITNAVVTSLHPIFLIAAALAVVGFVVGTQLKEIPLANRVAPRGE